MANFPTTKTKAAKSHKFLGSLLKQTLGMIKPAERLTVSEAAAKYRKLNTPMAYVGPWINETTPYLVEFMDELSSLDFTGIAFVGPARAGKSDVVHNWILHSALCDPGDTIIYAMKQSRAHELSNKEVRSLLFNTKELGEQLMPGKNNNTTYLKRFKSGMSLMIRWPSLTELSGKTIPRVWFEDYDHIQQDNDQIANEGPAFNLGQKRTQTFGRFGMTVAESSINRPIEDPKWVPSTLHEAPPTKNGILAIYNRGDRRRWYWRCPQCDDPFEPDFKHFNWPDLKDFKEASEQVTLVCPHCGFPIPPSMKSELNAKGRWVKEGMTWNADGSMTGKPIRTNIASFWLKGPCAAFQSWEEMVFKYLQAKDHYERTGDESQLSATTMGDQGSYYIPKALTAGRLPETLQEHARDWGTTRENPTVPEGVRFIVNSIDVQAGTRRGFYVQSTGFGEGGDAWVIDSYRITKSERVDERGDLLPIDPSAYPEDWDLLIKHVIEKSYELADGSGRRMATKLTVCDYGGEDGVSVMQRNFWRNLRKERGDAYARRFQIVKGDPNKNIPIFQIRYPDAHQRDKYTAARGDVPVAFLNSLKLKDALNGLLGRTDPGGGMWRFPIWLPGWFYSQMTAEIRTAERWEKPKNQRVHNESWDLSYYALAALEHPDIQANRPGFWTNPPAWAQEWDRNTLVFGAEQKSPFERKPTKKVSLEELAQKLA